MPKHKSSVSQTNAINAFPSVIFQLIALHNLLDQHFPQQLWWPQGGR
jgi:hypothetical protein